MPQNIKYVVPENQRAIYQKAYDSGRMSLDILRKLRIAGMPKADGEVRAEAALENLKRLAASFEVELKE